jgi:integrase
MGRARTSEKSIDPATGRQLPANVTYRGPHQYRARKLVSGHRTTKTFETARLAKDWLNATEVDSRRGVFVDRGEAERTSLRQIIVRYVAEELGEDSEKRGAVEEEKGHIPTILKDPVCDVRMAALVRSDVVAFRNRMTARGYAPGTIVRRLNILSQIIAHAIREWDLPIVNNPATAKEVKRPKGADKRRDRVLEPASHNDIVAAEAIGAELPKSEEERLLEAMKASDNSWDYWMVKWALATAMRQGETCALRWVDIDLKGRTVAVHGRARIGTKNGDVQRRPLLPDAIEILESIPAGDGAKARVFPVAQNAFKVRYARIVKRAGIANLTYHDLRHVATTRIAKLFPNPLDLMRVTGHKDIKSLNRYYHADPAELAKKGEEAAKAEAANRQPRISATKFRLTFRPSRKREVA